MFALVDEPRVVHDEAAAEGSQPSADTTGAVLSNSNDTNGANGLPIVVRF